MTLLAHTNADTEIRKDSADKKRTFPANKGVDLKGKRTVGGVMLAQERTFVNWCNLFLKNRGFQIKRLEDLDDGVCFVILLQHFTSHKLQCRPESPHENWENILKFLEGEDIQIDESPASVEDASRRLQIISFIVWRVILRYQICDDIPTSTKLHTSFYKKAPKRLLKWIRSKLPQSDVTNFNVDWRNGLVLCDLVNTLGSTGLIPGGTYSQDHNDEINIRLAVATADDELGVPELFDPYDLANGMVDEKCLMTYLSLLRSADKIKQTDDLTSMNDDDVDDVDTTDAILSTFKAGTNRIRHKRSKCVAFGAGLRWGQVGKPSEFFIQVNGPEFSDLSISIECRPFDHRSTNHKPALEIKSMDSTCYVVKYTPTRPGEYILNVFCSGRHITGSPFRLEVHETVLSELYQDDEIRITFNPTKVSYTGSHLLMDDVLNVSGKSNDSAFYDDDDLTASLNQSSSSETNSKTARKNKKSKEAENLFNFEAERVRVYGSGLKQGEVGLVCAFQVYTPNHDKGPLGVSITCPAMSIPVPHVTSSLHATYMKHDVVYLPTEPGVYQVDVMWGEEPLPGSPYFLAIAETQEQGADGTGDEGFNKMEEEEGKEAKISYYSRSSTNNLIMYYSATTSDQTARGKKFYLEQMLRQENPFSSSLVCITIDLQVARICRKRIFERASSRDLPMIFVNEKFVGCYEDVMAWYERGELVDVLLKCAGEGDEDEGVH